MMRVINWSFGSFFRTLGRIFAYIAIALILLFIGSKLNLFKTMEVNALTNLPYDDATLTYRMWNQFTNSLESSNTLAFNEGALNLSVSNGGNTYEPYLGVLTPRIYADFSAGNIYTIKMGLAVTFNRTNTASTTTNAGIFQTFYTELLYGNTTASSTGQTQDIISSGLCKYEQTTTDNRFYVTCNVSFKEDAKYFSIWWRNKASILESNWTVSSLRLWSLDISYEAGNNAAINNQTQVIIDGNKEINNNLNDLNDDIMNDDITDANNTASGFFNNFDTEDHGGLSSIVRAPLNAINNMLNGTCEPMTATFKGKTLSLPCGDILWSRPNADGLKSFINLIFGGPIVYGILIGFYKMIERLKNPDDDRVDVMTL